MASRVFADTLTEWLAGNRSPVLIDVRFAQLGSIPGAVHIPVLELEDEPREFPKDRDLVVFCQHGGGASDYAAEVLEAQGYDRVFVLHGGADAFLAIQALKLNPPSPPSSEDSQS